MARVSPRALLDAVHAERFPGWRDVLNEAAEKPLPLPEEKLKAARSAARSDTDRAARRRVLEELPDWRCRRYKREHKNVIRLDRRRKAA